MRDSVTKYFAFPIQSIFTLWKNSIDSYPLLFDTGSPDLFPPGAASSFGVCSWFKTRRMALNAQFRLARHACQVEIEDRARHVDRREQVRQQTDNQGDSEPPDGSRSEQEQEGRRN